jgi:hypothetical protein
MKVIVGFFLLALFAVPSRAQLNIQDGNYLLGSCQITIRVMENADTP